MVAPAGEPRSASTPPSVGRETAGQIAPSRGSTSPAYKMAGAALTKGDRMSRAVHRQRGRRIIKAQIGRTNRLLARKSKSICPPLRTFMATSRAGSGGKSGVSECHSCSHLLFFCMLRVSTSYCSDVAHVNMVANKTCFSAGGGHVAHVNSRLYASG